MEKKNGKSFHCFFLLLNFFLLDFNRSLCFLVCPSLCATFCLLIFYTLMQILPPSSTLLFPFSFPLQLDFSLLPHCIKFNTYPPSFRMAEPIITFDEPDKKFLPGDKVTGKVTLELTKPMKARSVQIYWMGFSRTWGVKFISYPNSKTIFYGTEMVWVAKGGKVSWEWKLDNFEVCHGTIQSANFYRKSKSNS